MSTSFPQQARLRKVIYFVLIVGLFSATLVLRKYVVEPRGTALELREESLGEVELTGSAMRLTLTGSRGIAVCYLWVLADQKKKKHEWNELELIVNSVTKLQPHFYEPWLFQSWNLAYNVSVEADDPKDKFFYVSRGIELLAEGERRNKGNPDLRENMGFYYQNKIGMADENNYFRCLFQMSCIDPKERDPQLRPPGTEFQKMVNGRPEVDLVQFREFCEKHPTLVRRLRDKLGKDQPYKVIEFLKDARRVPSLYEEAVSKQAQTPMKSPERRFPVLPPPDKAREISSDSVLVDDFDNFLASRAWMGYALEPWYESRRKPRKPAFKIFMGYPARAQAYYADRLEQGGWFDEDGWTITDWFDKPVTVGPNTAWAVNAWDKAFNLYQQYGLYKDPQDPRDVALYKSPEELSGLTDAERHEYDYGNQLTNFKHWYFTTQVEKDKETVQARKLFYQAERLRATPRKAIEMYRNPAAFGPPSSWFKDKSIEFKPVGWKKILIEHDNFRRDQTVQEESFESEMKYLDMERQVSDGLFEQFRWLAIVGSSGPSAAGVITPAALLMSDRGAPFRGPLDDVDRDGQPLIGKAARDTVLYRLKTNKK